MRADLILPNNQNFTVVAKRSSSDRKAIIHNKSDQLDQPKVFAPLSSSVTHTHHLVFNKEVLQEAPVLYEEVSTVEFLISQHLTNLYILFQKGN